MTCSISNFASTNWAEPPANLGTRPRLSQIPGGGELAQNIGGTLGPTCSLHLRPSLLFPSFLLCVEIAQYFWSPATSRAASIASASGQ